MSKKNYNFFIKCNLLGDTGVGKTSLGNLFSNKEFNENINSTIGVDYFSKQIIINTNKHKLQIWELSGNKNFNNIIDVYMKKISISFIIFDLNNKKTFENLYFWIDKVKNNSSKSIIILIGNKSDLKKNISIEEINKFINQYKIKYIELSIKNKDGSKKLHDELKEILYKIDKINEINKIDRSCCYC